MAKRQTAIQRLMHMTTDWQDEYSAAAAALGRKGGKVRSEAKADAARANGAKGGRPKRTP